MGVLLLDRENPGSILRTRDHVQFVGEWPDRFRNESDPLAGTYWRILKTQQIRKQNIQILQQGEALATRIFELELNDANGFHPRNPLSMYEVRISFRGAALLYVIWPTPSTLFHELEHPSFRPDVTSETERYVGFFEPTDLGSEEKAFREKLLRLHIVDDMQPILLRFYADTFEADEKIVVDFLVNRTKLERVDQPPQAWRPIFHFEEFTARW